MVPALSAGKSVLSQMDVWQQAIVNKATALGYKVN
jgi:hypothetical protein